MNPRTSLGTRSNVGMAKPSLPVRQAGNIWRLLEIHVVCRRSVLSACPQVKYRCRCSVKYYFPGQTLALVQGFGNVLGLFLGEALQRIDCDSAMGFQHLRELGCVQSRKPGGFFEGMFRGHDHQKQPITGADPLKTSTDPDTPRNPSLQGASPHGASSLWPLDRDRVADDR